VLREAYGLPPATSFKQITGEDSQRFPSDPLIDRNDPINDPNILDFVDLRDAAGNPLPPGTVEGAVLGTRRSPPG
jgi:peroxidase